MNQLEHISDQPNTPPLGHPEVVREAYETLIKNDTPGGTNPAQTDRIEEVRKQASTQAKNFASESYNLDAGNQNALSAQVMELANCKQEIEHLEEEMAQYQGQSFLGKVTHFFAIRALEHEWEENIRKKKILESKLSLNVRSVH
ncbi:MAG: hypothetical protein UY07_C0039G0008 [Parcubacteria group bacterium GW2011_GWA1_47_8]|nr:MAG: hypothetical protein UY07_C0039G0008 [Parcubacteria group bacterium GW2011_GWA1_47_8]KKW07665.1 MAG: hypothetical protein UY42_C0009G0038 [Parcubacteria group bacterium GW2011_GWA2_49_16]